MMLPTLEMPEGCAVCTACGHVFCLGRVWRRETTPARMHRQPRVSFNIAGCKECGHIMRNVSDKLRDLTRAEADELAASPDFPRVRERVLEAVGHLIG